MRAFTALMVAVMAFMLCFMLLGYYEQTRGANPLNRIAGISAVITAVVVTFYLVAL